MPTREAMIAMVGNQMMKGVNPSRIPTRQQTAFLRRHEKPIRWILNRLPRYSSAVAAVLLKAIIMDQEKGLKLLNKLRDCQFEGTNDPAFLMWSYLQRSRNKPTLDIYRRMTYAAKSYLENKSIRQLRPSKTDLFKWDDDFMIPQPWIESYAAFEESCVEAGRVIS